MPPTAAAPQAVLQVRAAAVPRDHPIFGTDLSTDYD